MKKLVLCAAVLAILGCSTAYVPPSSQQPGTNISINNSSSKFAGVAVFDDAQECYKSHIASRLDPGKSGQIAIPVGKPLAMHFQQLGVGSGTGPGLTASMCNVIITFQPEAGYSYSSVLRDTDGQCSVELTARTSSGATHEVRSVLREFTPPMGFTNKWCPPLTEQQASEIR